MATWVIQFDFDDGQGWVDIHDLVKTKNLRRKRILYNKLTPATSTVTFQMLRDTTIITKLLTTTKEIKVLITKNAAPYFSGYIRKNFKVLVETNIKWVKIECVDKGFLLKKTIDDTFAYSNYKVAWTTNPSISLVHQLLYKAGLVLGEINTLTIDKTVDYFINIHDDGKTYHTAIKELLFEFGFVFYFDESGKFTIFDMFPATATSAYTFDNDNMIGKLEVNKNLEQQEGVSVHWWEHRVETDIVVFSDTTGGDSSNKCNITLAATGDPDGGDYYPSGSDSRTVYSEYKINDREIITVNNLTHDITRESGINLTGPTNYYKRADFKLVNSLGTEKSITKLDLRGDPVFKGDLNITKRLNVAGTEKIKTIDTKYLTSLADAVKLSNGIAGYYGYSDFIYKLTSADDVQIGTIVTLEEDLLGISNKCIVVTREDFEDLEQSKYTLDGIDEYSADSTDTESIHIEPEPLPPGSVSDLEGVPSYQEIIEGFDEGGGTTTPTTPTASAVGYFKTIAIRWDRQLDLTNFDHYDLQVSIDQVDWYDLAFDGAGAFNGWGETKNNLTETTMEIILHENIPASGTEEIPTATTLYYRVRRVTKAAAESSWSSIVSASTSVIGGVDIGKDSISTPKLLGGSVTADKVDVATLNTLIANINQYILVSANGFTGTSYVEEAPTIGDQRARLDSNELVIEYFDHSETWVTIAKMGGDEDGGFFPWFQARGLIKTGAVSEVNALNVGHRVPAGSKIFDFENVYTDRDSADPWDTKSGTSFTTDSLIGTHALTTTSSGYIEDNDANSITWSDDFGINTWYRVASAPGSATELLSLEGETANTFGGLTAKTSVGVSAPGDVATIDENHVLCTYWDTGSPYYGKAKVGTIPKNGGAISWGTTYTFSGTSGVYDANCVMLTSTKGVIFYRDRDSSPADLLTARVVNVSGSTLTFGSTEYRVNSSVSVNIPHSGAVATVDSTRFVATYRNGTNVIAIVGTVSGDTISFGSEYTAATSAQWMCSLCVYDTNKFVVAYDTGPGYLRVGTISSGNVISYGSAVSYVSDPGGLSYICALDSTHVVANYNSQYKQGYIRCASISGTTISLGSAVKYYGLPDAGYYTNNQYIDKIDSTHYVAYYRRYVSPSVYRTDGFLGSVSGTTVTIGSQVTLGTVGHDNASGCYLDGNKFCLLWQDRSSNVLYYVIGNIDKTKLTLEVEGTDLREIIQNNKDFVYTTKQVTISTGWHYIGFNYDNTGDKLYLTIGSSTTEIDTSSYTFSTSTPSLKISVPETGYRVDNLLIMSSDFFDDTIDYFDYGLIWSESVDELKDLVLVPKTDGNVVVNEGLVVHNIPTSSSGLVSGRIWSDGGTLKIVS
ncbi:hypothetical protein DRQ25_08915 [Candidatus Fermentibacteria bacterium]|nr:MAG: hypothetical protein DRQ25_08915 [Candidatus Fermentibacteria bacterium]